MQEMEDLKQYATFVTRSYRDVTDSLSYLKNQKRSYWHYWTVGMRYVPKGCCLYVDTPDRVFFYITYLGTF